jgi:hypothetical protein
MKPRLFGAVLSLWLVATPALVDTVILRDGASYNGQFTPRNGEIAFSDSQGIQYKFPVRDVQSLVFSSTTHPDRSAAKPVGPAGQGRADSNNASPGQLFAATVREDVPDSVGGVAIPSGSSAKLVVRNSTSGGAVHSPELILDLFSVSVGGREYWVVSSDVDLNSARGVGKNKRTQSIHYEPRLQHQRPIQTEAHQRFGGHLHFLPARKNLRQQAGSRASRRADSRPAPASKHSA